MSLGKYKERIELNASILALKAEKEVAENGAKAAEKESEGKNESQKIKDIKENLG